MLITCTECRTSFRFQMRWLRGYKEARVRCRKCGARIVVRNPAMRPATPPKAAGSMVSAEGFARPSKSGRREGILGEVPGGVRTGQGDPIPGPVADNEKETRERTGSRDSGAMEESAGAAPESGVSPEIRVEACGEETASTGFDISGRISLEPDGSQNGKEEDFPPSAFQEARPSFSEDDVYAPPVEVLPPGQGEAWQPVNPSTGFQPSHGASPRPAYKWITDVALITVILVFGGVCGYFAVRYFLNVIGVDLG